MPFVRCYVQTWRPRRSVSVFGVRCDDRVHSRGSLWRCRRAVSPRRRRGRSPVERCGSLLRMPRASTGGHRRQRGPSARLQPHRSSRSRCRCGRRDDPGRRWRTAKPPWDPRTRRHIRRRRPQPTTRFFQPPRPRRRPGAASAPLEPASVSCRRGGRALTWVEVRHSARRCRGGGSARLAQRTRRYCRPPVGLLRPGPLARGRRSPARRHGSATSTLGMDRLQAVLRCRPLTSRVGPGSPVQLVRSRARPWSTSSRWCWESCRACSSSRRTSLRVAPTVRPRAHASNPASSATCARRSAAVCQRVDDGLWISVGVGAGSRVELVVGDIGERGLGARQCLFHTVGVQHRDVAAVRRVLDRRPCIWLGSLTQVAAGIRELTTPAAAERSQRREQRGVVEHVTIETARLAALVFGPHRRQSGRRHTTTARYPPPVAAIRQTEFALQARRGPRSRCYTDLRSPT